MNQIQKTINFIDTNEETEFSSCPECGGLGGLPMDNPSNPVECCWGCGGSGRIEDYYARKKCWGEMVQ